MTYRFKLNPIGKPRMTRQDKWRGQPGCKPIRPAVAAYRAFADQLRLQANKIGFKVPEGMSLTFRIQMPKSWSKKKKAEHVGKPHKGKPDIDNILKAFLDSLCEDDSYVWHTDVAKYWAYEGSIEASYL